MESRFWRTLSANTAIGIVIEYAICLAIAWYFNDSNQYFYALLIMLAFWAVQIGIWVKSQVVALIFYYLTGKKQLMARMESQLSHFKMPVYDDFAAPDATSYLTRVAQDKASNTDQVTLAANILGGIQMLGEVKPTVAWKMMSVLEAALENYRRRVPIDLHRAGEGVAENEVGDDNSSSGFTTATDILSDEESNRQSGLVSLIQAKSRLASFIAWSALTAEERDDLQQKDWNRYLRLRDEVFGKYEELSDEFYRDAAAHNLVDMLTIAGETERARELVNSMTVDFIKEKATADFESGAKALHERLHKSPDEERDLKS